VAFSAVMYIIAIIIISFPENLFIALGAWWKRIIANLAKATSRFDPSRIRLVKKEFAFIAYMTLFVAVFANYILYIPKACPVYVFPA